MDESRDKAEHIMGMVWDLEALISAKLGSCTLERPIGVGGMGAVYLARQEYPHRQVAVKVVHPPATIGAEERAQFLERFRREADAAAVLDHANIVPIYEFGENGDLAYLVMPYLADGSLADLLAREGPPPLERTTSYITEAAAALDYAHAHGIIHQDVKPSNLLLHPDGRLLLADFGIAHVAGDPTGGAATRQPGRAWGTPEYMAPEQISGEQITEATDLYGLGILAYTMLTGHPPFEGASTEDVLSQQLHEAPPTLRSLRPDVPPRVEEVVNWALAKQPADRPTSAGTFARALEEAAVGEGAASAAASQRTLDRLTAGVQPFARTLTRLIFRNDAVTAPAADTAPSAQPAAGILASQRSDVPASAVQPTDGQAPTWPMATSRPEAEVDPGTTRRQRNAASPSTDASRILVPILIGILVFLLAVTRGFAEPNTPGLVPDGSEPANGTPVSASNTSS
ncbi:MAG TPA: serine/threonine-protein kinase, partial [Ktedonobacterales bacterium]|nr:serine/threonine-protein kinase [Ktedonobacterales bacterium]